MVHSWPNQPPLKTSRFWLATLAPNTRTLETLGLYDSMGGPPLRSGLVRGRLGPCVSGLLGPLKTPRSSSLHRPIEPVSKSPGCSEA